MLATLLAGSAPFPGMVEDQRGAPMTLERWAAETMPAEPASAVVGVRSGGAPLAPVVSHEARSPIFGRRKAIPEHQLTGIGSWGNGWSGVVTRLPRGTPITVTGPLGSWSGLSVGYGPAVRTGRIADLSREVFELICGNPRKGLCGVVLAW